ncbi:hypothetical protein [Roseibium sp.]|uniref:hypothetical protein n=1 Tax=Roseibium sp. TaxID=1936156 RepID=UPI003299A773
MSNDLTTQDPVFARLLAVKSQASAARLQELPLQFAPESGLAPTILIARYDGAVGASTAAAILAMLWPQPLLIQIGGNASRALSGLAKESLLRFETNDPNRIENALDARMEHASRPAIVEFEQTLFREAISTTQILRGGEFGSAAALIFVASPHDRNLPYRTLAEEAGIDDLIVLAKPQAGKESREGVIRMPALPKKVADAVYSEGMTLREAIRTCSGVYSREAFGLALQNFRNEIEARLVP